MSKSYIINYLLKLSFISLLLFGCSQSPTSEYEKMIKNYLVEKLNDPKSYQSVETIIMPSSSEYIKLFKHTYRAANSYNALVKTTSYYIFYSFTNEKPKIVEIDNLIYSEFKDFLVDRESEEIFTTIGTTRDILIAKIKQDKNAIRVFCNDLSKYNPRIELINTVPKYMSLLTLMSAMPDEMATIFIDSF